MVTSINDSFTLYRINFLSQKMITADLFDLASEDFNIKSEATTKQYDFENYSYDHAAPNKLN